MSEKKAKAQRKAKVIQMQKPETMKGRLEKRLEKLKAEFDVGQKKLANLTTQRERLRNGLLVTTGAIQVLEEELGKEDGGSEGD